MATILDDIIAEKHNELETLPAGDVERGRTPVSLYDCIKNSGTMAVISEVKRSSPSKGDINADIVPKEQAAKYAAGGADAISVLTDRKFFKGTIGDLEAVKAAVDIPVLNKDFIIDKRQINHAYSHGADVILLIAAAMDDDTLAELYHHAKTLGLDIIVEVHDETEMERALGIDADIIGINNRNLKTFTVDISNTEHLLKKYKNDQTVFIAESGIRTADDAFRMQQAGASALLVGETLMRAEDPADKIKELKGVRRGEG